MGRVRPAIDAVLTESDYLESYIAIECLVAREILARLKGNWGSRGAFSERVDQWVEEAKITPNPDLLVRADAAISRVLGAESELQELWGEDEVNADWHREMDELWARVKG